MINLSSSLSSTCARYLERFTLQDFQDVVLFADVLDTMHHDGFGLNDAIQIFGSNAVEMPSSQYPEKIPAFHKYTCVIDQKVVAEIQFQKGPRHEEGSISGVTQTAILSIIIDQLQAFQKTQYACRENTIALTHLETAHLWMRQRAHERHKRGVLGTNKK